MGVCVGGGGWPKATAWATKGGPTWGREQIFLPSRNTNNQKKNFQTGAEPMLPRRKMFFSLFVARGQHGCFHPRQAGCAGIKEYIATEGTTQARVNRNKGRGAATAGHFCNNPNT